MSRFGGAVAVLLVLVLSAPARADDEADTEEPHHEMAAFEAAVVFGIPMVGYWTTPNHQSLDWTMDWDWATWRTKLFTVDKLRFDSNPFTVNAFRHPLVGVLDYQLARTNGFGVGSSTLFAFGAGVLWEYLIEFKENPSINDLIINGVAGIAIGEPLWQIGQLWRGGEMSLADRARTALFSPFDTLHDTYRDTPRSRRRAWRAIELGAGAMMRVEADARAELVGDADLEVVSQPERATGAAYDGPTRPGTWSRVHGQLRFGDLGDGPRITGSFLHTRTSLVGRYHQDGAGTGTFFGLGTAFTYRREYLAAEWDRLGIAHLIGPQLQLSKRAARHALFWDAAVYGDFAMTHALVFGPISPFPPAPPRVTSLQTDGYYHAFGLSAITRLRVAAEAWGMDVELAGHRMWQIDAVDRNDSVDVTPMGEPLTANGTTDWRAFARVKLTLQTGSWGIAAIGEGAYRQGAWAGHARALVDLTVGLVTHVEL